MALIWRSWTPIKHTVRSVAHVAKLVRQVTGDSVRRLAASGPFTQPFTWHSDTCTHRRTPRLQAARKHEQVHVPAEGLFLLETPPPKVHSAA